MKVIAFEGLDNSGKSTQCQLLKNNLENDGYSVSLISGNDSTIYPVIRKLFQRGEFSPFTNALLFAADIFDRWYVLDGSSDVIIFDRYLYSLVTYGLMNGLGKKWIANITQPLQQADIIFFLDISLEEYLERIQGNEIYISPYPLSKLAIVRENYYTLCEEYGFFYIDGHLTKEEIGMIVYLAMKRLLHTP